MLAPSTSAPLAAAFDWHNTDLGTPDGWPHTLALSVEIMLGTPAPLLLLWGAQRIPVYNQAYAEMMGVASAPGAARAGSPAAPLAAAPEACARAAAGQAVQLSGQQLSGAQQQLACDLQLTPLRGPDGAVQGVLCAVARSAEPALAASERCLRVLVVEDNLDSQYLVCEMLKAFGHDADGVGHAEGALEQLAQQRYDVLFSDVSLPGMSGVDLARQALRTDPALQVIFASGYGEALLRHVEFPFQSLQKPYEIEQLQAALAQSGARPSV